METSEQHTNLQEAQQIKEFIEAFVEYLRSMGTFAIKIGETEQKYPHALQMMTEMASPENIANFISKAPKEIVVKLLELILRASGLSARMQTNLNQLSPKEKIQLGNDMIKVAGMMTDLMRKGEER
jgi:hypothetical protein